MGKQTDPSFSSGLPPLGVRTAVHGNHAVLAPHGEIDYVSTPALDQALNGLPEGVASVLLNMAEVTFMDSSGLHFLYRLRAFGRRRGIPVRAVHFALQPRQVLEADGSYSLTEPEGPVGAAGPATALLQEPASSGAVYLAPAPMSEPAAPTPSEAEGVEQFREEIRQLRHALESRAMIDQAQGMIMALGPCSADVAWGALVQISQHTNTKLRDVAAALVASTEGRPLPADLQREIGQAFDRLPAPAP